MATVIVVHFSQEKLCTKIVKQLNMVRTAELNVLLKDEYITIPADALSRHHENMSI